MLIKLGSNLKKISNIQVLFYVIFLGCFMFSKNIEIQFEIRNPNAQFFNDMPPNPFDSISPFQQLFMNDVAKQMMSKINF